jgi:hypothetical protein
VIPKPGKPADEVTSYRPISLLPIMSKVFEKGHLKRLHTVQKDRKILPDRQFGFRQQHSTTEQIHRVPNTIRKALKKKEILLSCIPGHHASIPRGMATRITVQNKE